MCWMCVTGKSRSVWLPIFSPGRSFGKWSCWIKAGYWLGGQSQVQPMQCCAKCSTSPTNSSTTGRISKPSLQKAPHLDTRPCWFQWCTYHGNSVTTLLHGGTRTTHSLGPTPKRCNVPPHEHVLSICMYLYTCMIIVINICIHIPQYLYKYVLPYIHMYTNTDVCMNIYTGIYIHMCMYTCLKIYNENVANLGDSQTEWLFVRSSWSYARSESHPHTRAYKYYQYIHAPILVWFSGMSTCDTLIVQRSGM